MRGRGEIGEVGERVSITLFALGIADVMIGELVAKSESDPRVRENGSWKLSPSPLTSFMPFLPESSGMSSSPLTSHVNGLDPFTPPVRLL